jgi:hypothetical protein
MAFGQAAGPPASRRQVETLGELIRAAGHVDFRDARGPLGLNQRQAGGRFTRDEADALITRLEAEAEVDPEVEAAEVDVADAEVLHSLRGVPAAVLAAELQRRGWIVMEP